MQGRGYPFQSSFSLWIFQSRVARRGGLELSCRNKWSLFPECQKVAASVFALGIHPRIQEPTRTLIPQKTASFSLFDVWSFSKPITGVNFDRLEVIQSLLRVLWEMDSLNLYLFINTNLGRARVVVDELAPWRFDLLYKTCYVMSGHGNGP